MGNAATKQLDATELGVGKADAGKSIAKAFLSSTPIKIKNKGKTWVQYDDGDTETLLWTSLSVGMIKSHSVIQDSTGKPVAVIVTEKKGMASCTQFVCRDVPSYDGQEPLTDDECKKAGIKEGYGKLYKFAKIETSRKFTTAKCSYGLVTGTEAIEALYEGEKLSSMGFKAIFTEVGGDVVAKAYMPGMSMSPRVDTASGVDLLAIVSIGYSLVSDNSSAGALAGAGVV